MNSLLQSPARSSTTPNEVKRRIATATIAVCTRNRPVLLQKCLAAVSRLNPGPKEVLVIDNCEGNSDTRKVARDYCARYIVEPLCGLCRARNRALAESDTDIVVFLDDDVTPCSDWLKLLVEPFDDERIGATGGQVVTPDSFPADHYRRQSTRIISDRDPHWFEMAAFGGIGFGANMALRKSACPPGKFFDERLGRGAPFEIGDESYAFAAMLSRGRSVAYIPSAIVHHPPLTRFELKREARNSFAYWLLLFSEFPRQRLALLRFLGGRLMGKELAWPRDSREPGEIVSSSWSLKLEAAFKGLSLFVKSPKRP
ncbi:glycosyltransferase [Occallatibacter savannae]|uniref:glycosyltransferase n=1 Tax=Occallatibacter savannae TaxID=1002691 RepID=UPI000D69C315|nr:glycosyltransferase family 2 protein [Occallatibacter savannae]